MIFEIQIAWLQICSNYVNTTDVQEKTKTKLRDVARPRPPNMNTTPWIYAVLCRTRTPSFLNFYMYVQFQPSRTAKFLLSQTSIWRAARIERGRRHRRRRRPCRPGSGGGCFHPPASTEGGQTLRGRVQPQSSFSSSKKISDPNHEDNPPPSVPCDPNGTMSNPM